MKINVVQSVLKANDAVAAENRRRLDASGVLAINLMSAPGSGKTTLLQSTLKSLRDEGLRCGVLVGDLQTTRDAERLSPFATETTQINTGTGCHLTATQVAEGISSLHPEDLAFLFIENVGNMVCPAEFELGEHLKVVLLSTPEGDDKVAKYPTLFQRADAILLTKTDLLTVLEFRKQRVYDDLSRINTRAQVIELSSKSGEGLPVWLDWLRARRAERSGRG